jgi:hypothetical protein
MGCLLGRHPVLYTWATGSFRRATSAFGGAKFCGFDWNSNFPAGIPWPTAVP